MRMVRHAGDLASLVLVALLAQVLAVAIRNDPLRGGSADVLCNGLFGCGAGPPLWQLELASLFAAGVLAVIALKVHDGDTA